MKKLYFRWKDEACNGVNPEWVEMTGKEFLEFKRKPENKHRKFIACTDEYGETSTIVMEVTREKYNEWRREEERKRRKREEEKKQGYKLVSMDDEMEGVEISDITLHDVLPDESANVEADVCKHCMGQHLQEVLKELSDDEVKLINSLYLGEKPLTESAYADYLGVSQQAINKKKLIVLGKLKKFF